jgi:hypothetical protein
MSATGYIYMYALMEKQPYALAMQKEMIDQVDNLAEIIETELVRIISI